MGKIDLKLSTPLNWGVLENYSKTPQSEQPGGGADDLRGHGDAVALLDEDGNVAEAHGAEVHLVPLGDLQQTHSPIIGLRNLFMFTSFLRLFTYSSIQCINQAL